MLDVNQTRFHLIYGEEDWCPFHEVDGSPPLERAVHWNKKDATLELAPKLFRFPMRRGEKPPTIEHRRGAGRDRYGNWYWIAESQKEIRFLGARQKQSEHFWCAEDESRECPTPPKDGEFFPTRPADKIRELMFSGLAVTEDHYLILGLSNPKGLLVFDLHGGGSPLEFHWPEEIEFTPFDISPSPKGGVWILDRAHKTYWGLDRYFRIIVPHAPLDSTDVTDMDFKPDDEEPRQKLREMPSIQVTPDMAMHVGAADPVAIEGLPDGSVLILDSPPECAYSLLLRYRHQALIGGPFSLESVLERFVPDTGVSKSIRAHDFAFLPAQTSQREKVSPRLYLVDKEGNQSFGFEWKAEERGVELGLLPKYYPMRLFTGRGLVTAGNLVYYDAEDQWSPLIAQPRPRYRTKAQWILPVRVQQANGNLGGATEEETPAFDGRQPACIWHRLFLDACIPPGGGVKVESRAADTKELLKTAPWREEPCPYLRKDGAEIPFYKPAITGPIDRVGTWELLFQKAVGRYLQLRLTLEGTGRNTPRLHALRIYYPRFSYLKEYLPAIYRENEDSAWFLDRYLANVEGFYTVLEGKIENIQGLCDTRIVPAEYLEWLGGWMGATLDPAWDEKRRRLFLSHAPQMYRERGTLMGLLHVLRLALEECPDESLFDCSLSASYGASCCTVDQKSFSVRIVERFLTRRAPGVIYGDPTDVLGPGSTTEALDWTPAHGAEPLHRRYRSYLRQKYVTISEFNKAWKTNYAAFDDPSLRLPALLPKEKEQANDWGRFLREALGFTYAVATRSDESLYREFLARRYRHIGDLNDAYGLTGSKALKQFTEIRLLDVLPEGGPQLRDWIQFVSLVLPTQRNAHRFTVLVPVGLDDDLETQPTKLEVARRITALEKPAHTDFDVRLYWGMFRVGEARLGLDTILGQGSRSVALVLGRGYLGAGHLAFAEPWNVLNRLVVGRERLTGQTVRTPSEERMT